MHKRVRAAWVAARPTLIILATSVRPSVMRLRASSSRASAIRPPPAMSDTPTPTRSLLMVISGGWAMAAASAAATLSRLSISRPARPPSSPPFSLKRDDSRSDVLMDMGDGSITDDELAGGRERASDWRAVLRGGTSPSSVSLAPRMAAYSSCNASESSPPWMGLSCHAVMWSSRSLTAATDRLSTAAVSAPLLSLSGASTLFMTSAFSLSISSRSRE
mmetsp:Transcript_45215/g.127675  ORF Transcript_45215/g.127675 Transcript_45215/m.127675 type:complete len:218 (+) Transcript_45215:2785-3438(+)